MLIILTSLWLLLSGHYTGLILSLGLISILLVSVLSIRMQLLDYEQPDSFRQTVYSIPYGFWLLKEIVKSNIDVSLRILNPALPIKPQLYNLKTSQRAELARVSHANSITLTPGTISIDVDDDSIEVHVLSQSGLEGLLDGEMDARITRVEDRSYG